MKDKPVRLVEAAPPVPKKDRHQVWISQEVYEFIARRSIPLVDSPDSTLRRLFGLPQKEKRDK